MRAQHHPHPSRAIDALAGIDLLRGAAPSDLSPLAGDTDLLEVPAGAVVERTGATARQLVGIVDGAVRGVGPDGDVVVLGPGDQVGAAELVHDRPHARTYTTVVPTTLVVVFGPAFRALAPSLPATPTGRPIADHPGSAPDRPVALAAATS